MDGPIGLGKNFNNVRALDHQVVIDLPRRGYKSLAAFGCHLADLESENVSTHVAMPFLCPVSKDTICREAQAIRCTCTRASGKMETK